MNTPYICVRCRHKLAFPFIHLQRSSFVSLQNLVNRNDKGSRTLPETAAERTAEEPRLVKTAKGESRLKIQSTKKTVHQKPQENDKLEDLFSSNLRNSHAFLQKHLNASSPSTQQLVDEDIKSLAHRYYEGKASLALMWQLIEHLFQSEQWKLVEEQRRNDEVPPLSIRQLDVFRDVLLGIAHQKAIDPATSGLPKANRVIQVYAARGVMQSWWDQTLWEQLGPYIRKSLYPTCLESGMEVHDSTASWKVLRDIISVWWDVFKAYGEHREGHYNGGSQMSKPNNRYQWSGIPSRSGCHSANHSMSANVLERISAIWPQYPDPKTNRTDIFLAAIMTLDILERQMIRLGSAHGLLRDTEPLVHFLRNLVQGCSLGRDTAVSQLKKQGINQQVRADIMRHWNSLGVTVGIDDTTNTSAAPTLSDTRVRYSASTPSKDSLEALYANITQARVKEDAASASKLWQQCQSLFSTSKPEASVSDRIFSNLLVSLFALRCQTQAVEVWNFMIKQGHQPTQMHWRAMLTGCAKAKDLTSLREIWGNMVAEGVKPDSDTWTTWIDGLMVCRAWNLGLNALSSLGKQWKTKPRKEALQPSLEPVKAALTGLVFNRRLEYLEHVHQFAKTHGLTYDIHAYNILLRPAIRADDDKKVQALFTEMRLTGCQPDIVTFTIILNGLLSNVTSTFHTQSPSEQQAAIFKILGDMVNAGVNANARTYSTILDGLLNDRTMNIDAAQAVLQHMATNSVRVSPHIYTILITHYFSVDPPNLAAINALLERAKMERVPLDPIFYDRMIENYARVGEIEKMLKVLRGIPERGMTPGWITLTACLKTLFDAGEWESAKDLVKDVSDDKGLFKHGLPTQWKGKDGFWELVRDVKGRGVLDDLDMGPT